MEDVDPLMEYQGRQFCAFDETLDEEDSAYFDIDHETGQRVSKMLESTPNRIDSPSTCGDTNYLAWYPKITMTTPFLGSESSDFKVETTEAATGSETQSSMFKGTTIAKPFRFQTEERNKGSKQKQTSHKEVDFVQNLRHNTPKRFVPLRTTEPKPFSFDQAIGKGKCKVSDSRTMAEKINLFLKNTPDRFRTKAAGTVFQPQERSVAGVKELVRPCAPKLQTEKRQRRHQVLSHEQLEEMELQQIKSYQFHARPFNKRLLKSPDLPKPCPKRITIPVDVHLGIEKGRAFDKKAKAEEKYVFHAREVPKKMLCGPVGLKDKIHIPVTHPKSPAFALKKRSEDWRQSTLSDLNSDQKVFKANPVPRCASPFAVTHDKKCTAPQPFSFDRHDKERYSLKQQRIQEEIENDKKHAEFYARPLPDMNKTFKSNTVVKAPLTNPIPFNFELEKRTKKLKLKQIEDQEEMVKFKNSALREKSYVPHDTTVDGEFQFSTLKRAVERMKLRELQATAEADNTCLFLQQQKETEEKEKAELRQLRQALVHKAQPVKSYKPIDIKKSKKILTLPQSPKFATEIRLAKQKN